MTIRSGSRRERSVGTAWCSRLVVGLLEWRLSRHQPTVGVVWGIWHLPAFLLGGTPHADWAFAAFFTGVVGLSVLMTAMFNTARGSLLIPVLFHFQINVARLPSRGRAASNAPVGTVVRGPVSATSGLSRDRCRRR